jgi:serine/threonine-protein kinase
VGSDATWIGKCLDGRYQIEQQLGAGGAGTVYRARHLGLNRPVAVKVLLRQHQLRQASRQRFEREAQALAQLSHEHVVAISDCGVAEDMPFLVMELLEGEGLDARLKRGKPPPELGLQLMRELLLGLGYVHERGLVHRDIKPGNLFLEQRPGGVRLKLLDFGLAKLLDTSGERGLTMSGEVFGTPAYMPPEQITGEGIDARSDVYSAALVCFELFAGRRAYSGHEAELFRQHLVEPLPPLGLPAALAPLEALLQRATDKNKQQRFAHAGEMLAALDALGLSTAGAQPRAALPQRSSPARAPARPHARARRRGGGALRAGALVVCALALAAIVLAGGAIFVLGGPEGGARRSALKRALTTPSSEPAPAPKAR